MQYKDYYATLGLDASMAAAFDFNPRATMEE